jgi:hypothetical protein
MIQIPTNPVGPLPKPRDMDLIIAQWLGWTEIQADDGAVYGRTPDGQLKVIPLFSTSRFALQLALEIVEARGLSHKLHCYLRRVIWFGDGNRQMGNATDLQKCSALVLMISECGGQG